MPLAPVALFVYNRLEHTRRTLNALKNNLLSSESDLIVFSDGPKDKEDQDKIVELREFLKTISGFKTIRIVERPVNYGLAKSIISGVTEIVNECGRIIVLEDDLVTSPYFLQYMNDALNYYELEEKVISIHGYIYPVKEKLPETFFIKGADCWGWATWKRGWDIFNADGKSLLRELEDRDLGKEFNFDNTYPYVDMLKGQIEGRNNSWAIRWYASAFLKNKLTLYPGVSLVQNIGFDNSGTHCGDSGGLFEVNLYNERLPINKIIIEENKIAKEEMKKYHKIINKQINIILRIIHKVRRKSYKFFIEIKNYKKIIKKMLPVSITNEISGFLGGIKYGFFGNYATWEDAKKECAGYDSEKILEKVKNSALKVKNGEAKYERDSVLFNEVQYSWPLLSFLLWISSQNDNKLNLIDFGGSLGSTYFQNIFFLKHLNELKWNIVEQQNYVNCGSQYFTSENIRFYKDIETCVQIKMPDVILLSGAIQYIKDPYLLLSEIINCNFAYIIFDRTTFLETHESDRLTIQKVPSGIYDASYPCWFFDKDNFMDFMLKKYVLISEFTALGGAIKEHGIKGEYKGLFFKLKN